MTDSVGGLLKFAQTDNSRATIDKIIQVLEIAIETLDNLWNYGNSDNMSSLIEEASTHMETVAKNYLMQTLTENTNNE